MNDRTNSSRQDRPIRAEASDQLDRGPFVQSLVRALVMDDTPEVGERVGRRSTGYVVGLTGRWGLGKSSVLNLLAAELGSMDRVIVAEFNPWLFKGRDELVMGFFNSLRAAIGRSSSEEARALVGLVDRYWGAINVAGHGVAAVWDIHGGAGTGLLGWKTWGPRIRNAIKMKPRSPDEERQALEKKIEQIRCAVVVLIDELDRVEDEEVRAVAQLVKAVGGIKGVSYLVAYDPDRVADALGRGSGSERRQSGERYLEKIIQHPIPLRPLFSDDIEALLIGALADHELEWAEPSNENQKKMLRHLVGVIETPREVKRLIGAYSVLERAVRGEICPYDVLGYCWILTKSPGVRDSLAAHLDELVSDPSVSAMSDRLVRQMNKEKEPDVVDVLGPASEPHRQTLQLLFPRFSRQSDAKDGDRLSKRRNLVRMLFLGNPPGMARRVEVEELWRELDPDASEVQMRTLVEQGKLRSIIDRLDDLFEPPRDCRRPFGLNYAAMGVSSSMA